MLFRSTMQNAQMQALANQMQSKGRAGMQSPVAGAQAMNAQTGRTAPQQGQPQSPAGFGGGMQGA